MKKLCFVLAASFLALGCERHPTPNESAMGHIPVAIPAVLNDTPPPYPEVDPDLQQDQSGPIYKDSIIPGTGMTRWQRDSILKWRDGYATDNPGKGVSTRTDFLVKPVPGEPYDTALYNRQAPIREQLERNQRRQGHPPLKDSLEGKGRK